MTLPRMSDAVRKMLLPAAPPLLLIILLVAVMVEQHAFKPNDSRPPKGTSTEEAGQLLLRVSHARTAVQLLLTNAAYPLEQVLAKLPTPPAAPAIGTTPVVKAPDLSREKAPPPVTPQESVLNINGIAWAGEKRVACVNNRLVAEGGMVAGFKVVKIEPRQVTFADLNGRTHIVRFK